MKHTKRIAALLLALALCFSCAACSKTVGSYRVVKTLGTEQFRIGFRDGDQAAVYVNAALKVLAADGTIHSLALKWFGTDDTTFDSDANALDALGDIPQRTFIMGLNEERFPMSYADGDGCWLEIRLMAFSGDGVMCVDTEDADMHRLTINGYPAFTTHKNGMSTVVCTLDDWSSVLTVTGKGFSVDDLAQVAEGVQVR